MSTYEHFSVIHDEYNSEEGYCPGINASFAQIFKGYNYCEVISAITTNPSLGYCDEVRS